LILNLLQTTDPVCHNQKNS